MSKKLFLILFSFTIIYLFIFSCTVPDNPSVVSDVEDNSKQFNDGFLYDAVTTATTVGNISSNKSSPYITITETSTGKYHVKINLRPSNSLPYSRVKFTIGRDGNGSGFQVNIGNSVSNNGWGGDSSDQQNDSEILIKDNDLMIYANDKGNSERLVYKESWWDREIYFTIKDNYIYYQRYYETGVTLENDNIFCLNGQTDNEGPVDYIFYAAFNRVIDGEYRSGTGVGTVRIDFYDPVYTKLNVYSNLTLAENHYGEVEIMNNNITLDLGDRSVYGPGSGVGITINNKQNVTIKSGAIRSFDRGILMEGNGSGNIISGVRAYYNNSEGFRLNNLNGSGGSTSAKLSDCLAYGNKDEGFHIEGTSNYTFNSCDSKYSTNEGFRIENSQYLTFYDCYSYRNNRDGYDFNNTDNLELNSCSSELNVINGIELDYCENPILYQCSSLNNGTGTGTTGRHGISVSNGSNNFQIDQCTANDNGRDGIHITDNIYNGTLSNNDALRNGKDGIRLNNNANNNRIEYNTSSNNVDDQYDEDNCSGNVKIGNSWQ